jgi:hypothetical protein
LLSYARTPFQSYPLIGEVVAEMREQAFGGAYEYRVALPKKLNV